MEPENPINPTIKPDKLLNNTLITKDKPESSVNPASIPRDEPDTLLNDPGTITEDEPNILLNLHEPTPIRENEQDKYIVVNVNHPPEIVLSLNLKYPPPDAEDEQNHPLNYPARLIIKHNLYNNPLESLNNTPSNEPPSSTEIEPDDDLSNLTDLTPNTEDDERDCEGQPIDNRLLKAAISGNSSELKHLLLHNPEIDLLGTTPQKSTCLHISSIFGRLEFSKAVLALRQSLLSRVNSYGETPLIAAVTNGHVILATTLLQKYRELNLSEMILKSDVNGDTVLHHAIRHGHTNLALELIDAERDLSKELNKYNESPLFMAVLRGFSDVLERLLQIPLSSHVGPNNRNALHAAVRNGNLGIVQKIAVARPFLAKEEDNGGTTPMQLSVVHNKLDVIRGFLEHDRSLGYLVSSKTATPLLISAAFRDNVGVAEEILNYCPDAPYCDPDGWTMLHEAVEDGHEHTVEFILKTPQLHKLINMQDKNGDTAMHIAVRKCDPKIVSALLAHKATDLTIVNNDNDTADWQLLDSSKHAKTLNWNEVMMMMSKASPQALTALSSQEAKKEITDKSNEDIKSLSKTYTNNTSLIAILIATITFAAAFTLPGGYSNDKETEGLPVMGRKPAFKAFLICDTLAMCSSLAVAFICILTRWEDMKFLLYYRSFTTKLMWFAYMATTVAFATGLYTVVAPRILWLAILICILSIGLPFLTYLLGKWPILKLQYRLGPAFKSHLLDMV